MNYNVHMNMTEMQMKLVLQAVEAKVEELEFKCERYEEMEFLSRSADTFTDREALENFCDELTNAISNIE